MGGSFEGVSLLSPAIASRECLRGVIAAKSSRYMTGFFIFVHRRGGLCEYVRPAVSFWQFCEIGRF